MCRFVHALVALSLSASAAAQFVWPPQQAAAPGNAVMNAPFRSVAGAPTTKTRCMVVLDAASGPFPIGTTVTQIALRRDASYGAQGYAALQGSLRVRMGRAVAAPDGIQDVRFARLWQGAPTTVYDAPNGTFSSPAAPPPVGGAPPFSIVVPLQRPFQWQGGPLAIEFLYTPTAGTSLWRVDAVATPRSAGSFRSLGPGCGGSNGYRGQQYVLTETAVPGGQMQVVVEGAVRPVAPGSLQDVAIHVLGASGTAIGGVPLPLDLGPLLGTPSGCLLRNDALATLTVPLANPSLLFGRASNQVAVPATPAIAGAQVFSQWLLFDLALSAPFRATVSDGIEITVGSYVGAVTPRRARTLWKYGATGFDIDSGVMADGEYGPVLRFQ